METAARFPSMAHLPLWLKHYATLPKSIMLYAAGNFLLNLIHAAQFLLLNLFLKSHALDDPAIAALTSQRYVATFFLAIPAGLWLRGKKLRGPIIWSAALFPIVSLLSLMAVQSHSMALASWCFLLMGVTSLIINVANMPMVLRIVHPDHASEAFSLMFASWAAASVCGGLLAWVMQKIHHLSWFGSTILLDEYATLMVLTALGLAAPLCFAKLPNPPPTERPDQHWLHLDKKDIPILLRALVPCLVIATGAGLSIQFMNLFFSNVHHLSSADYSAYSSFSNVLMLCAGLLVPAVRRRFGWRGAIVGVQLIAVVLLFLLGFTELWRGSWAAIPIAIACFILRQPLMSMAGPAVSELTMNYVGERNRELISACSGAIWSGSWWLAARIFQALRSMDFPYWSVFLATGILYIFGTLYYLTLIKSVEKQP
jgi:predicted MFS family arabinose efflux permease